MFAHVYSATYTHKRRHTYSSTYHMVSYWYSQSIKVPLFASPRSKFQPAFSYVRSTSDRKSGSHEIMSWNGMTCEQPPNKIQDSNGFHIKKSRPKTRPLSRHCSCWPYARGPFPIFPCWEYQVWFPGLKEALGLRTWENRCFCCPPIGGCPWIIQHWSNPP